MIKTQTIPWAPFSQKHKDYINNAMSSRICVAEGAIRSGKTIDNCIIAAAYLEKCRDRIHLASGSTIGNAKLNIGVCNGFGLENLFRGRCKWGKYKDNEALFLYTQTGEKIVVFAGGGKADSYKRILGNSYGLWIATEINEHYDSDDSRESFIKVAFGRQAAALDQLVLWDLNPCNPNHRIYYSYIDKYLEDDLDGYLYEHFTIDDNLAIDEKRIEQIKAQYDPQSVWYRRDILGERCVAQGLVYPMFDPAKHVTEKRTGGEYYIAVDYGTVNPCAMELICLHNGEAHVCDEYYYNSREKNNRRTDEEHYKGLEKLAEGHDIRRVIVDPSAASFKETIRRHGKFAVWDADNSVLDGIRLTGTLLQAGKITMSAKCDGLIQEIQSYVWDEDAPEDAVIKENDHACLTGDTLVETVAGPVAIKDLVGKTGLVYCAHDGKAVLGNYHDVRMTQEQAEVFEIELTDGKTVKATANHPMLTKRGWVQVKDLRGDDEIACIGGLENECDVQRQCGTV